VTTDAPASVGSAGPNDDGGEHTPSTLTTPATSATTAAPSTRPTAPIDDRPRFSELFGRDLRALTIGLVLLLGSNAFEIVGSATAMPAVLDDVGGVGAYGWAIAAPLVAAVLAAPYGGRLADRWGALRPLLLTLALFATGLVAAALAPTMETVALGRFLQGLGAGGSMSLQLVIIARYVPMRLRPLMLGAISTVFIVPGLVGPTISAAVAESVGWRWIFGGVVPVTMLCAVLLVPELARRPPLAEGPAPATAPNGSAWGPLLLATGLGLGVLTGSAADLRWLPLAAVGVVLGVIGARSTMPPGTWRARPGLPAAVAVGLAITFAYLTMESFLPLLLRELKDLPLILAGMPLTAAAIFWTAGAWYQARLPPERRPRAAAIGGFVSAVGLAVAATLVFDAVPFWLAYPATAVGAFGCGVAFTICQTVAVEFAPPGQEGAATAGVQLSNLLGAAIGTSVTAIVIAHLDDQLPLAIGLSFLTTALAALVAGAIAPRLPGRGPDDRPTHPPVRTDLAPPGGSPSSGPSSPPAPPIRATPPTGGT
jgi:MFS family permease